MTLRNYLIGAFCLFCAPAYAAITTVTVNCNGGAADYPSISAAVAALKTLPVSGNAVINVTGSCTENVVIDNFAELTLQGQPGATIAPAISSNTIRIDHSNKIIVRGFTIRGGNPAAVLVRRSSGVVIDTCLVGNPALKGPAGGVRFEDKSLGFVIDSSIINFTSTALVVTTGSVATFRSAVPVSLSNSSAGGIVSNLSSLTVSGKVTIEGNLSSALIASFNSTLFVTDCSPGEMAIRGSLYGLSSVNSTLAVACPVVIEQNQYWGVLSEASGSTSLFNAVIRNNGIGAQGPGGGVALGNVNFLFNSVQILNNFGSGITAFHGANGNMSFMTVQGNSGDGIQVTQRSLVEFAGPNTVTGHPGTDLLCNTDGSGFGSKTGIGKITCPGFSSQSGPKPFVPPIP